MKKTIATIATYFGLMAFAIAQTAPTRPNGDNTNAIATTAFVHNSFSAVSGDCTFTLGVIICTKTNGTPFGTFATQSAPTGVVANCLQANSSGVVSGTGSACGTGGTGAVNSVSNSDGSLNISPTTGAVVASINPANANTWTANQSFAGAAIFGGSPWFDVRSTAHGCAAADPTGATDSTTAIQCHINYMYTTYSGGTVYLPCGSYLVSGGAVGLLVKGGVALHMGGMSCTSLDVATDSNVVTFDAATCSRGAGLYDGFVIGYQNAAAAQHTVEVGANCNPIIADDYIWAGSVALNTHGVDGHISNVFACGYAFCVASDGANWYDRVKLDSWGHNPTNYAFEQVANASSAENHFQGSDFTCSCAGSVVISDGHNNSITGIMNSVLDSPIGINNARFVMFVADEIGNTNFTVGAGTLLMTATAAFASTTVTGAGARSCAANVNFTNC